MTSDPGADLLLVVSFVGGVLTLAASGTAYGSGSYLWAPTWAVLFALGFVLVLAALLVALEL